MSPARSRRSPTGASARPFAWATAVAWLALGWPGLAMPPAGPPAPAAVTWSRQIAPLLYANCTTCHHPGGAGPFSLLTYADARRWAPQVLTVTQSRFMPPWLPEPGFGDLAESRRMSDRDLALIRRWVAAGSPQGDPAQAPQPPSYSSTWTLGKPDLVLTVDEPFTLAAGGQDVFRNFILPNPLHETRYVRAMEILPGVAAIVHHANILIDRTGEYRRQHPNDWKQGVPGMEVVVDAGKSFDPDGHFLFWKPDTPALLEPEGMPWRLDPGNDLILNMHLKPSGKAETIRAQVGLYFTASPPRQTPMLLQLDRDDALDIPAGQADFPVEDEMTLPVAVHLLGIYPHAHYLGKEMKAWAILPGGKKVWLIWIRDWDIDRQSVYSYREPVLLPAGTTLHMRYVYDNSAANPHNPHDPPVEVRAGNRSEDEMAHLWLQMLPVATGKEAGDPRLKLEEAWMRSRLRRNPNDYVSLYNLGAALAGEDKQADAAEVFERILNRNPRDSRSWNALGAARETGGDWRGAREAFARAAQADAGSDPGNCDARFNLGQVDLKHDLAADAEAAFRAYLSHCGEDADAHGGLGEALAAEQQYESAEAEFLRALALDPAPPAAVSVREHLAFAYAQEGRLDDALTELRAAAQVAPPDASLHGLLAQVLGQKGQLTEAIAEQKSALALGSQDAGGWNNLGVFEARNGDSEAARQAFEQAQRIDPGNAEAKANLARLKPRP